MIPIRKLRVIILLVCGCSILILCIYLRLYTDEDDFHWLTGRLVDSVTATGGRVISVLEGGYSLTSPVPAPAASTSSTTAPLVTATRTRGGGHATEDTTGQDGKSGPAIVSPGTTTAATATATAAVATHTKAKGVVKKEKGITTIPQPLTPYRSVKYAQHTGDGGLVKGVLAHVAALAGVDFWRTEENL